MLNVELFDNFVLKEKDLESSSLEILLSVDCHMEITIDNRIFYSDWICPIELYYHYKLWRNKIKTNTFNDFIYITEDNGVNPILVFKCINKDTWKIDSCFKKYNEEKIFTTDQVIDFFSQYEKLLLKHINVHS